MDQNQTTNGSRSSLIRLALSLFFVYHLLSIVITLIPNPSPIKNAVDPCFWHYRNATGMDQFWDLFITAANNRDSNVTLVASREDGSTVKLGPMLPGFTEYNPKRTFRHMTMLDRFMMASHSDYLDALGAKYAEELRKNGSINATSVEMETVVDRLNVLDVIREGGDVSYPSVSVRGPWRVTK